VDIELPTSLRGFLDGFLSLFFASHKKHFTAPSGDIAEKSCRFLKLPNGLAEIDDIDRVSLLEDERLHLWIQTFCLVAKVNACFEEFGHQFSRHRKKGREACANLQASARGFLA